MSCDEESEPVESGDPGPDESLKAEAQTDVQVEDPVEPADALREEPVEESVPELAGDLDLDDSKAMNLVLELG